MPEPGYRIPMQWMKSCVIIRSMFNGSVTVAPSRSRSDPRPAFGLPEVLVAVSTSRLSCKRAGKTQTLMPV
jgi:hypothetical protein